MKFKDQTLTYLKICEPIQQFTPLINKTRDIY